jgi:hypothetical protein
VRREEIEAVIAKIDKQDAEFVETVTRMTEDGSGDPTWWEGAREGLLRARRIIADALVKSEAGPEPEPGQRMLLLPAAESFAKTYSGVAMSTGIEFPEFGPGLWIVETVE